MRKTCVKKLKSSQVPEESIIKVTGHKTAKGLRAYDEGDHIELQAMSNILSNEPSTSKAPPSPRIQALDTEPIEQRSTV